MAKLIVVILSFIFTLPLFAQEANFAGGCFWGVEIHDPIQKGHQGAV